MVGARSFFVGRALAAVERLILVLEAGSTLMAAVEHKEKLREAHMQRALLLYHAGHTVRTGDTSLHATVGCSSTTQVTQSELVIQVYMLP
jgi:hypothetical protein